MSLDLQAILVAVAIASAALPVVCFVRGRGRRMLVACGVLGLSIVIVWTTKSFQPPVAHAEPPTDRPIEESSDGYVSSRACRSCHPSTYASWHATYHRSMTQLATPEAVIPEFDGVVLKKGPFSARLQRRGDEFWVDMDDLNWTGVGERPPRVQRQVVMTTGSHNQQVFWLNASDDRKVQVLPFVYLIQEERWIPRGSSFLTPSSRHESPPGPPTNGLWNRTCSKCHTTHVVPRLGGRRKDIEKATIDTRITEFGISCEACHGPGEDHVRVNRDPARRYELHLGDEPDPTIVQPEHLSNRKASQTCGQCHSVNYLASEEDWPRFSEHGFRYRPGDELTDTRCIVRLTQHPNLPRQNELLKKDKRLFDELFWSDGMVRVSGAEYNGLLETPCFQRGELSCLSCHSMHKSADDPRPLKEWANDLLKYKMDGNRACLQCHEQYESEDKLAAHTHHSADSSGSQCYNCHMPHTSYGLLKAIRSHQIDVPSAAATKRKGTKQTGRPNACNLCHLDKTLQWTSEHLHQWYDAETPELTYDEQNVAASLLWLLRGDAGQRALIAWSMGWKPAQEASGTDWMAAYLHWSLADGYDAVRFIGQRSIRSLPGFADLRYNFISPFQARMEASQQVLKDWKRSRENKPPAGSRALLFHEDGELRETTIRRLLRQRDKRAVILRE